METASVPAADAPAAAETGEKGLQNDAIGFWDGLSIGLAFTATAYSLAVGTIFVGGLATLFRGGRGRGRDDGDRGDMRWGH